MRGSKLDMPTRRAASIRPEERRDVDRWHGLSNSSTDAQCSLSFHSRAVAGSAASESRTILSNMSNRMERNGRWEEHDEVAYHSNLDNDERRID
jgi:hypothetical protein